MADESQSMGDFELDDDEDEPGDIELKQRKSGVLYFSRIPPKFTPSRLQEYFEKHAPGLIGRVHCTGFPSKPTISSVGTKNYDYFMLPVLANFHEISCREIFPLQNRTAARY
ncbi:hypothetical protein Y032_0015g2534 [Ancylostoma ceylanicum]|uniref:Uncharacterized protein n=1 Tax=Ancylostoma ceylanicum TaxID=53326 RepID=A0A016V923_9BILA|nr:hypothetical protein Y032_0015g2534 [Ancylostoma ceylanicum]